MENKKVVKIDDVKAGLERLGLLAMIGNTKDKNWKRIYIHVPQGKDHHGIERPTLYIGRMSFNHGLLYSWKMFGIPDFWACAIKLMVEKGTILSHINYYVLGVQAYNETIHLREEADKLTSKKAQNKAIQNYYYVKSKLFTFLFRKRYYPELAENTGTFHVSGI